MIGTLFIILLLLILIGAPIYVALGGSSLLWVYLVNSVPDFVVLHRMVNGIDSFPLLAVPFFILAGSLMNIVGVTKKIFNFAEALVGRLPGGLGHVNIGASIIFAGMSGAAMADAGGLGIIEIEAMENAGYDKDFSIAVTAASSTIGPIIPPSLPLVIYAVMASASVSKLFVAGIIPGLLMGITLSLMVLYFSKKRNYPRGEAFSIKRLGITFIKSFPALMTPIIIIGGISTGIFTATEAAIAAVVYSLILGLVYKTITFKKFIIACLETVETTSITLLIVAGASIFAWILTSAHVTEMLAYLLLNISNNKYILLLLINLFLAIVGCFMETTAAITILTPVLLPIVLQLGVNPIQFGIIMVLNLMIGLLTPPVGMVLYVLSRVAKVPFERCAVATIPFIIPLLIVLLMVTFIPALSTWLPMLLLG